MDGCPALPATGGTTWIALLAMLLLAAGVAAVAAGRRPRLLVIDDVDRGGDADGRPGRLGRRRQRLRDADHPPAVTAHHDRPHRGDHDPQQPHRRHDAADHQLAADDAAIDTPPRTTPVDLPPPPVDPPPPPPVDPPPRPPPVDPPPPRRQSTAASRPTASPHPRHPPPAVPPMAQPDSVQLVWEVGDAAPKTIHLQLLQNDALGNPEATIRRFGGQDLITTVATPGTIQHGVQPVKVTVDASGLMTVDADRPQFTVEVRFTYHVENAAGGSDTTVTITLVRGGSTPV